MGVKEIDNAFMAMIDKSAELLNIGKPEAAFSMLKQPEIKEVKSEVDFTRIIELAVTEKELYQEDYLPLLTELKRFEPDSLMFSALEPGQGVSFTARNIARLWREDGKKVLLIEFYNGFSGSCYDNPLDEKAEAVKNNDILEDYLVQLENENVYLYSVRASAIKNGFIEFWQILQNSFEMIIVDAAPQGFNIMADRLFSSVTGVIMISSHKPDPVLVQSFEKEVKENQGRFFGIVMNAVD